jgi:hypothetical protein
VAKYQVIVGNIGTVYDGDDKEKAYKDYRDYVRISQENNDGRATGEQVHFIQDGEPIMEYFPEREQE